MCVWLQGDYLALDISKTNKHINTKFYTQYQTRVEITFSGFDENRETEVG